MGLLPRTAYAGSVTYETESAVFYFESGRKTTYVVATGIPNDPSLNLKAYSWSGHLDSCGPSVLRNESKEAPPRARSLFLEIRAITTDKVMAYWIEEQAAQWQPKLYGKRLVVPPPLPA